MGERGCQVGISSGAIWRRQPLTSLQQHGSWRRPRKCERSVTPIPPATSEESRCFQEQDPADSISICCCFPRLANVISTVIKGSRSFRHQHKRTRLLFLQFSVILPKPPPPVDAPLWDSGPGDPLELLQKAANISEQHVKYWRMRLKYKSHSCLLELRMRS